MPSRWSTLNSLANLPESILSVFFRLSLLLVGTSAGLTTMLFIPKERNSLSAQKPLKPAS
jgi:hypothetical protein